MKTASQMLQTLRINHSVATRNAQYATENRIASQPLTFGATPEQMAARVQYVYDHDDTITKMSEARAQVVSELQKLTAPKPACDLHKGMHLFVWVGERGGDDIYRCACLAEMRNAKDAWYPDETRYLVVEQAEEDEALAAVPDAQEQVLTAQLAASLKR